MSICQITILKTTISDLGHGCKSMSIGMKFDDGFGKSLPYQSVIIRGKQNLFEVLISDEKGIIDNKIYFYEDDFPEFIF